MKFIKFPALVLMLALLAGCATTQEITLAKANSSKKISTIAQVPDADNSAQMNTNLETALQKQNLTLKAPLPAGTRKSTDVDAIVSYSDVWRWDLIMYLKSLTIRLYDAETGDLLAHGQWQDSQMHGFKDAKLVMEGLVSEMFSKLRAAPK